MRHTHTPIHLHTYKLHTHAVTLGILDVFQMDYKMFGKLFSNVPPENFCGLAPAFRSPLPFLQHLTVAACQGGGILERGWAAGVVKTCFIGSLACSQNVFRVRVLEARK